MVTRLVVFRRRHSAISIQGGGTMARSNDSVAYAAELAREAANLARRATPPESVDAQRSSEERRAADFGQAIVLLADAVAILVEHLET
jgi:hypothetical protein